jgi:hypothetical protein
VVASGCAREVAPVFDGEAALSLAAHQMSFGPRIVGTPAHAEAREWILDSLEKSGWGTAVHSTVYRGVKLYNLVGKRGMSELGPIIIGAHYDTRPRADRSAEPGRAGAGANMALPAWRSCSVGSHRRGLEDQEVWLVFFDGEDSGIDDWEWARAAAFADDLGVTWR